MTKKDENLPPGAVQVESVFMTKDYAPDIPEIEPFRPPVVEDSKPAAKSAAKKEG